jgi:N-acetyl-gamma-glutamyl-phosphate reductase
VFGASGSLLGKVHEDKMKKIFVDGQHGTTGLQIVERLKSRKDIELVEIPHENRRDPSVRKRRLNEADLVFLCLPDAAAIESVAMIENPKTRIVDASTAHRTAEGWAYGLPEIRGFRDRIAASRRVANPGCYPTGLILMLRPLVDQGILPASYPVVVNAITGYSGGGKAMIATFESASGEAAAEIASRPKNLTLGHKHLPEMQKMVGLDHLPHFVPIVGNFYKGMLVFAPLFRSRLRVAADAPSVFETLSRYYGDEPFVQVHFLDDSNDLPDGFLSPTGCNSTNRVEIFVSGRADQLLLTARLDNLGKGASGAAIQNMNIMLGLGESEGLL